MRACVAASHAGGAAAGGARPAACARQRAAVPRRTAAVRRLTTRFKSKAPGHCLGALQRCPSTLEGSAVGSCAASLRGCIGCGAKLQRARCSRKLCRARRCAREGSAGRPWQGPGLMFLRRLHTQERKPQAHPRSAAFLGSLPFRVHSPQAEPLSWR